MNDDAPAPGEIWRLLLKIDKRLDQMVLEGHERDVRMDLMFVRKDVFEAVQGADALQIRAVEEEARSNIRRLEAIEQRRREDIKVAEDRRRADRALLLGSLAFPLLVLLITAAVLTGGPP